MGKTAHPSHAPLPVVSMSFLILGEAHGGFYSQLSTQCERLPQLTVWRIGAVINNLNTLNLVPHGTGCNSIAGSYPNVRPAGYNGPMYQRQSAVIGEVRYSLQRLAVKNHVKAVMECTVGIQESVLMLGFDKVLGAAVSTATSSSKYIKLAHTTYDWSMKTADYAEKYAKFYASLREESKPVQAFLTII